MKLELNTWERTRLSQWLGSGAPRGDLSFVRRALSILDKLELSDDEKREIGWTQIGNQIRWNDADRMWELEFNIQELSILTTAVTWEGWEVDAKVARLLERLDAIAIPK